MLLTFQDIFKPKLDMPMSVWLFSMNNDLTHLFQSLFSDV